MKDIYRGELVRLAMQAPEALTDAFARWERDSEFHRLGDSDPAMLRSKKKCKEWVEKWISRDPADFVLFSIRTLAEDRFIGYVTISPFWSGGNAWVGIAIGEPDCWGKGYGTDGMRLILQYAFIELNLHRVTLGVQGYNTRAIRSYEKAGFRMEGAIRGESLREGRRTDGFYMGILRSEWEDRAQARQG